MTKWKLLQNVRGYTSTYVRIKRKWNYIQILIAIRRRILKHNNYSHKWNSKIWFIRDWGGGERGLYVEGGIPIKSNIRRKKSVSSRTFSLALRQRRKEKKKISGGKNAVSLNYFNFHINDQLGKKGIETFRVWRKKCTVWKSWSGRKRGNYVFLI